MRYCWLFAGAMSLFLFQPALAKETSRERQLREMFSRTPDQIMPLIEVSGDAMDPSYKLSSYGVSVIVSKGLLFSTTYENSFLRGFVNKTTGNIIVQVYHSATYDASNWYHLRRATFETTDGIKQAELDRIATDVSCGRYGCTYSEDVAFDLPVETLDQVAQTYDPAKGQQFMRYRLFGQSGTTIDDVVPVNELTAFVMKLREVANRVKASQSK
jgi:hypothetical protein